MSHFIHVQIDVVWAILPIWEREKKRVKEFISFSIFGESRSFCCDLSFDLNWLNHWDLHDNENGLS